MDPMGQSSGYPLSRFLIQQIPAFRACATWFAMLLRDSVSFRWFFLGQKRGMNPTETGRNFT